MLNKQTVKIINRKYYLLNRERLKELRKQNYLMNIENIKKQQKHYRLHHKNQLNERNKKYYQKNKNVQREYRKQYYKNNKEIILNNQKQYYINNKEKILKQEVLYRKSHIEACRRRKNKYRHDHPEYREHERQYKLKNREKILIQRQKNQKIRTATDILYRVKQNIRRRVHHALQRTVKLHVFDKYIGCSKNYLIKYIESNFSPGMSWKNYGKFWDIDHIIGCNKFDLSKEDQQLLCFHYTNLCPLVKQYNRLIKRDWDKQHKLIDNQLANAQISAILLQKYLANSMPTAKSR
jgi:hypothetical protein